MSGGFLVCLDADFPAMGGFDVGRVGFWLSHTSAISCCGLGFDPVGALYLRPTLGTEWVGSVREGWVCLYSLLYSLAWSFVFTLGRSKQPSPPFSQVEAGSVANRSPREAGLAFIVEAFARFGRWAH